MSSWNDPRNAELYDLFTRKHPLYRETSRDLVKLANLQDAALVVDLACGTGVTTEAILERLAPAARVIAIDGSAAMLQVAQRRVPDPRVHWVVADGSEIAAYLNAAGAILCNSAIWQMDMPTTIAACAGALRSGGRLVFNIGRGYLAWPDAPNEPPAMPRSLPRLIQSIARRNYGFVPTAPDASLNPTRARQRTTLDDVTRMLIDAGLAPDAPEETEYDESAEAQFDWFSIPVFTEAVLVGMPPEQQREIIAAAYARVDKEPRKRTMFIFAAHKP